VGLRGIFCSGYVWGAVIVTCWCVPRGAAQLTQPAHAGRTGPQSVSTLPNFRSAIDAQGVLAEKTLAQWADSLGGVIREVAASAHQTYRRGTDSLITRGTHPLDGEEIMSLRALRDRADRRAKSISDHFLSNIRGSARRATELIRDAARRASLCDGCAGDEDFAERRSDFITWCDSTRDASLEDLDSDASFAIDSIESSYGNARDSVADEADRLLDEEESASHAVLSVAYDDPLVDRGRDNGIRLYAFTPTIQYNHRSGLFGSISGSWLNKAENNWDVTATTLGYQRTMWEEWAASVSFTHLWFSGTSPQAKSVLGNSIDAELDWSGTHLVSSVHVLYEFSGASEITLYLNVAARITVVESGHSNSLVFEPGVTGVYGQQDATLEQARLLKTSNGKGKKAAASTVVTTVKPVKTFDVLEYELTLPLTCRWDAYSVGVSYTIAVPLNIVDQSTDGIFGILGLGASLTIR
jgi:hypothetical protein